MSSQVIFTGTRHVLTRLIADFQAALDGIPDDDLNTWLPSAASHGGGEMNTLAALCVHTAKAGTWMLVHQVFGQNYDRDREGEFHATATRQEIDSLFADMLARFDALTAEHPQVDLAAMPTTIRPALPDWDKAAWLQHAVEHTGLHLGHAQITRQLWLAERAGQERP